MIYSAWTKGCRFDGWDETFEHDKWMEALEESGIDPQYMLGTIPVKSRLPWDHIDVGLEDKFLEREWKKATKNRLSPPCGKVAGMIVHHTNLEALEKTFDVDKKRIVCYHCGVECDLKEMVEERRDYLGSMNAVEDLPYEPPKERKKIVELREKRGQNVGHKYRIEFSKIGPLSFISHLDTQKIVARIFKRADVEILHSEGYKSRPLISFGPALTLGISSLREFFDVRVPEQWEKPEEILERLQRHSEKGILFNSIEEIVGKVPSIQDSVKEFTYFIKVDNPELLPKTLKDIQKQDQILVKSYNKKKKAFIQKDIKPKVEDIFLGELSLPEDKLNIIDEVSPCKGQGVFIKTKVDQGSSIRPSEIVEVLKSKGLQTHRPIKSEILLA